MAVLSTLYKACFLFCVTVANAQVLKTLISPGDGPGDPYDGIRSVPFPDISGFNVTRTQKTNGDYTIMTKYLFNGCSDSKKTALQQVVSDANDLAAAGLRYITVPGAPGGSSKRAIMDFDTVAAIEYFGPPDKNTAFHDVIFSMRVLVWCRAGTGFEEPSANTRKDTIYNATYAYRGWGWSDYFADRYVTLDCTDPNKSCGEDYAFFSPKSKTPGNYPMITFCQPWFQDLSSLDTVSKTVTANKKDEQKNFLNMRSQGLHSSNHTSSCCLETDTPSPTASNMLHEWIHMDWGTAAIHPGNDEFPPGGK